MARQEIELGTAPGGEDGDSARTAFTRVNEMTAELYAADAALQGRATALEEQSDTVAGRVTALEGETEALGAGKVDKIEGQGLSDTNFTQAEKDKLGGLESSRFKGVFVSLAALQAAHPPAEAGAYADVDAGVGAATVRYVWDVSDEEWQAIGAGVDLTPAQIKEFYESNPDTNAYSDAEKTKLGGIQPGATANVPDAQLRDRSTHTGQQTISTVSGLQAALDERLTAVTMSGAVVGSLPAESAEPISETDQLRQALAKLQAQIDQEPSAAGSALPMFGVLWWPSRTQIPAGFAAADGQLLSRASFPQAWTGIAGNQVPIALDVNWLNNPIHRGRYSLGDGSTTFRLPDYNGAYAGSLGGLFLRGSPTLGVAGNTVLDAFQGHKFDLAASQGGGILGNSAVGTGPAGNGNGVSATGAQAWATRLQTAATPISDGTNGAPRVAAETRPLHVQGVWIIKLFGAAVETGTVNIPQLASDVVALTSRVTVLEGQRETDRLRLHTDALWSGNVGSNGVALALSSPIAVGDLLFLRHTNADRSVSHPLVVTEGMMTAGRTAQWSFSSGGYTGLTYNSPTQFTTNGFTSGFGLSEIYRSKAGL